MVKLEIACFDEVSASLISDKNIDRIELCHHYNLGGVTPSLRSLINLKKQSDIPIFVMIRPRGGNFCYSKEEFQLMKTQLLDLKNAGADGFVFGILDDNNEINYQDNQELLQCADGLPCTFHRAFDHTSDLKKSLDILIDLGFSTVLTSGGTTSAMQGLDQLIELKKYANNSIEILAGGGVRSTNVAELQKYFNYLHSACVTDNSHQINLEELEAIINIIK